jgi:phosphoribosylglycinamide formyltransferase-1
MIKLEIWASGNGSNAERIVKYFKNHQQIKITSIATDNPNAGVIDRAKKLQVPCYIQTKEKRLSEDYVQELNQKIDGIILAGYLRLVNKKFTTSFYNRIINIHPSLLPLYGGKGMYGSNVHQAVLNNKETISGITIHKVNEHFDEGEIIAQFASSIKGITDISVLQKEIQKLEHKYFPRVIETYFTSNQI